MSPEGQGAWREPESCRQLGGAAGEVCGALRTPQMQTGSARRPGAGAAPAHPATRGPFSGLHRESSLVPAVVKPTQVSGP